jgi:antitoxin ParD1/3/4
MRQREIIINLNVSLTAELVSYVKTKVQSGRYTSSSEVVREALRIMEKQEQQEAEKLRWLREAWREGEASGEFGPLDADEIKQQGRLKLAGKP